MRSMGRGGDLRSQGREVRAERSSRSESAAEPGGGLRAASTSRWQHFASHLDLLTAVKPRPGTGRTPGVDLLVIPTSRANPADRHGMRTALQLARSGLVRRLLVLCSKHAAAPAAVTGLRTALRRRLPPHVSAAVTVVTDGAGALPAFAVDGLPLTCAHRRYAGGSAASWRPVNDVGLKRNLALLLAARLGMTYLLFLDDDVRPTAVAEPVGLARQGTLTAATAGAVMDVMARDGLSAVGWVLRGYDDNSVVCRARTLAGHPQDQFIGGGALLVRSPTTMPFFPAIYNEDWIFLLAAQGHRLMRSVLGWAGTVRQDKYDGYSAPRARSEEFGDLLGEGLMSLVHAGSLILGDAADDHAFWNEVVAERRQMIVSVWSDLQRMPQWSSARRSALAALDASLSVHRQVDDRRRFWTDQFARYVPTLRGDLQMWSTWLQRGSWHDNSDLLPSHATFTVGHEAERAFGLAAPVPFDPVSATPRT